MISLRCRSSGSLSRLRFASAISYSAEHCPAISCSGGVALLIDKPHLRWLRWKSEFCPINKSELDVAYPNPYHVVFFLTVTAQHNGALHSPVQAMHLCPGQIAITNHNVKHYCFRTWTNRNHNEPGPPRTFRDFGMYRPRSRIAVSTPRLPAQLAVYSHL